jgi:type II secretory ATPase GspE/PulE/Tfp pilus assembly ATPase PilB-like protein
MNELGEDTVKNIKSAISFIPKEEINERIWDKLQNPIFYKAVWCEKCDNIWYKWRVWIYEVLEITPWVKTMILAGQSAFNINIQAMKDGMISLEQDWIMKALNWQTTLEEVYKAAKTQE